MKKIILATAVAAFVLPSLAIAQDSNTNMTGAADTSTSAQGARANDVSPDSEGANMLDPDTANTTTATDAMDSGAMSTDTTASTTADTTGNYTIITKSAGEAQGRTTGQDANANTDSSSVLSTIEANPGLADALTANGIELDDINSISVEPNGQVTVFSKT